MTRADLCLLIPPPTRAAWTRPLMGPGHSALLRPRMLPPGQVQSPPHHEQPRSGASESLREGLGGVERALALRLSWVVLAPSSLHPAVPGSPKWLWPHLTASECYHRCAGGPPGGFVGCMAGGTQRRTAVWSHPTIPFAPLHLSLCPDSG